MRIKYTAISSKVSISSFIIAKDANEHLEMNVMNAIARQLNCNDYRIRDYKVSFGNSKKGSSPTESITVYYPDVSVEIDTDEFEERFAEELAEKEAYSQAWRDEREKRHEDGINREKHSLS